MGLDTSHGCWHGSYGSFAEWRCDLAKHLGWRFVPGRRRDDYLIPDEHLAPALGQFEKVADGNWDGIEPFDVIDVLMLHSDCDGIIPARFCEPLARRLGELGDLQQRDPDEDSQWWAERTLEFVCGLLRAAYHNEDVDFH